MNKIVLIIFSIFYCHIGFSQVSQCNNLFIKNQVSIITQDNNEISHEFLSHASVIMSFLKDADDPMLRNLDFVLKTLKDVGQEQSKQYEETLALKEHHDYLMQNLAEPEDIKLKALTVFVRRYFSGGYIENGKLIKPKEYYLSLEEKIALASYKVQDYVVINKELWNGHPCSDVLFFVDRINSALKKMPTYIGTVKRGLVIPEAEISKYTEESVIEFPAYTSTTKDMNMNIFENKHRFIILSKTGSDISELSINSKEKEVLFLPNTQFKVKKVEKNLPAGSYGPAVEMQITLEEI